MQRTREADPAGEGSSVILQSVSDLLKLAYVFLHMAVKEFFCNFYKWSNRPF